MTDEVPTVPASSYVAAVEGVAAWAAALTGAGVKAEDATALATNCLRDGYAQGMKAADARVGALHLALDHARTTVEHDAQKIVATAEAFWQWLKKEAA